MFINFRSQDDLSLLKPIQTSENNLNIFGGRIRNGVSSEILNKLSTKPPQIFKGVNFKSTFDQQTPNFGVFTANKNN